MTRARGWSCCFALVVGLTGPSGGNAFGRPCPPCPGDACVGDDAAADARAAKRKSLIASGAPARLVDSLLSRTAACERCFEALPDRLRIRLEYPGGNRWTLDYSRHDEKLARRGLRAGTIKALHVILTTAPCACCTQVPPVAL